MVSTTSAYSNSRYRVNSNEGFDGVVRVVAGGHYATGALLWGGQAVLTAAHLFEGLSLSASVHFETAAGSQTVSSSRVLLHPSYVGDGNHDLALVWLSGHAPIGADRYHLFREADAVGQRFDLLGYGRPGTGALGAVEPASGSPALLRAQNTWEADGAELKSALGVLMGWSPVPGSQWMADFDNGLLAQDALGRLMGRNDLGLGLDEGFMTPGDSGGPALVNGQIAGVASFLTSLSAGAVQPDLNPDAGSSFGELGAWQSVGFYQQWIDQSVRASYVDPPTKPEMVKKAVAEGLDGVSVVFFLLQFTGVRASPDQWLSVDFATRDGTAKAGQDYLASRGKLILYPGENQAVIPVEILADHVAEPDEVFYLDVFNPVGGNFGPGVTMLTGMRTILNDDGGLW
jgi:hypothetical protein